MRTWRFRAAAAAVAVCAVVLATVMTVGVGGHDAQMAVDDISESVAAFVAAALCALAARREFGRARLAWASLAGYAGVWGAGQTLWNVRELWLHQAIPTLWFTDAFYLGAMVFALAAAFLFQPRAQTGLARLAGFLDGLLIGSALLLVGWTTVVGAVFNGSADTVVQKAVLLAYPVLDIVVAAVIVTAAVRLGTRMRLTLFFVTLGILAIFVADGWFAYQNAKGTFSSGSPLDSMWTTGFLIVALGGLGTVLAPDGEQRVRVTASGDEQSRISLALPLLMVLLACAFTVQQRYVRGDTEWVVLGAMVALAILGSVRQLVHIAANRRMAHSLAEQATRDALTGLLNRREFSVRLDGALQACGPDHAVALLFIDLDGFKAINDTHGHAAGDVVLNAVARRIGAAVRPGDLVARLGGDEFAVLLTGGRNPHNAAVSSAERIRARLREPVRAGEHTELITSVSIGIAVTDSVETPAETLVGRADVAMYRAKAKGRDRYDVFDAGTHDAVVGRLRLQTDIRLALERRQFLLHFQPIVDLVTGRVVGVESLARWLHPERGLLHSDKFVPVAEDSGVIVELGRWFLREACRQAAQWQGGGGEVIYVSVNVAARQLREHTFVRDVFDALVEFQLPPQALVLEMTESDVMEEGTAADVALAELRRHGIRIAMDDFGTGFSSLSNLCRIPVDMLKTDGMFVRAEEGSPGALVASAILALGTSLGLSLVAEGIETAERAHAMRDMGYRFGQGYHLGRPAPADQLVALGFLPSRPELSSGGDARTRY
ncbi:MAG TPA: EAL domain-containing protein [Candidatus Dormibacteraeota bacterium]|nr:EAL domain-containing protein [Candidatus Dormibacteraeota bacterium]